MSSAEQDELRAACREMYGREFDDSELEYYGARLQRQLRALERLRVWEPKLGLVEPATVSSLYGGQSK